MRTAAGPPVISVRESAFPRSSCEAWLAAVDPADEAARTLSDLPGLDAEEVLRRVARSPLLEPLERALV